MDHLDGANGTLGVLRINVDQYDLSTLVLQLAEDRIAWSNRKTGMAEYDPGQVSALQPTVQDRGLVSVLRKESYGDPTHGSFLGVFGHATNFHPSSQMTFVIEGRTAT
jgi:hypothetical protein